MKRKSWTATAVLGLSLLVVLAGCAEDGTDGANAMDRETADDSTDGANAVDPETANERLHELAAAARERYRDLTFEEFRDTTFREKGEGGRWIVNGDTPVLNEKYLREFFDRNVREDPEAAPAAELVEAAESAVMGFAAAPDAAPVRIQMIVYQSLDAVWNSQRRRSLTYCMSTSFGQAYDEVVEAMTAAAQAWEAVADVDFIHDASHDADCTGSNPSVLFDVRPMTSSRFLALAFFPNYPRVKRNVLIDGDAIDRDPKDALQLVGILRHELGHTLGFRHEHTRPESGKCFEDRDWREVTDYDAFSVMHYPECNGRENWSLTLTDRDKHGAACMYTAADGFTIDRALLSEDVVCAAPASPSRAEPETQAFISQTVASGEEKQHGSFAVAPGSMFRAEITGDASDGDPDLYVAFGSEKPTLSFFHCRPFRVGPNESCALDVPEGATEVFVMVRGSEQRPEDGTYNLTVTHTPGNP